MLRLSKSLQHRLVTDIEALRVTFPGSAAPSVTGKVDLMFRDSVSACKPVNLGEGIDEGNRMPLTKEVLDLMDTPIPSGLLAAEFAYHGLTPSFLHETHQAHQLLDEIYTEIKKYINLP